MDADFWLERWREGRTHFHQQRVTPLLQKYWPSLELPAGSQVLVPLCGNRWICCGWRRKGCVCSAANCRNWRWNSFQRKRFAAGHPSIGARLSLRRRRYRIICGDISISMRRP